MNRKYITQENFATNKFILVEVPTEGLTIGNGRKFYLPDIPELRFQDGLKFTDALQAFTADQLSLAPSGNAVIPQAQAVNIVVVLTVIEDNSSNERIVRIPYFDLIASSNGGYYRTLDNLPIILTKSYVEVLNAAPMTADVSFVFGFHYWDANDKKKVK